MGTRKMNGLAHVVHEVEPELFHLVEYCIETICIVGEGICVGNWMNDVETAIYSEWISSQEIYRKRQNDNRQRC